MSYVSDRFAAILDANVLYPSLKRDVVLSFAASGLFRPRWSAEIMAEWSSRLLTRRPELGENIARTVEHMNQAFPEAPIEGYERLIEALELPDPNDRHVLAAAIKGGAHVIVTENTRDFPEAALRPFEIEIQTTDEFLLSTFELHPNAAEGAMRGMRKRHKHPSYSASELITRLTGGGLVRLAAALKPRIDVI